MDRRWEWLSAHQPLVSCVQMHGLTCVQLCDYVQGSHGVFFGVLMLFLQCVLTSLVMVEWLQHADTHYLTLPQFSGSVTE